MIPVSPKKLSLAGALVFGLLLCGCAGEEYTYVNDGDLKPGPGLLSGEDGVFTLYGKTPSEQAEKAAETKEQKETNPPQ